MIRKIFWINVGGEKVKRVVMVPVEDENDKQSPIEIYNRLLAAV